MSAQKTLNIGLVGYGFMGRTHSNAYRQVDHFFDLPYQPGAEGGLRRATPRRSRRSPTSWGYESIETDWRKLVERKDIDADRHRQRRTTRTPRSPSPRRKAGKMVLCEKPLARTPRKARRWSRRSRRPACRTWSGTTTAACRPSRWPSSSSTRAGSGKIFHYRAKFLQDWTISPDLPQGGAGCGGSTSKAAGSGVTGDLLAHCIDTALWLNGRIDRRHRDDRDVHQGAQAQPDRQGRAGRHRRRLRVPRPLRERLARHLRSDPLRARPQGALHVRDQRRACLARLGSARPASPAVLRPPRRRAAARLALASTSPTATIPT